MKTKDEPAMKDPQKPLPNINPTSQLVRWFIIIVVTGLAVTNYQNCQSSTEKLDFTALHQKIEKQEILEVQIKGNIIRGKYRKTKDSEPMAFETQIVESSADKIAEKLAEQGVKVQVLDQGSSWLNILFNWLPAVVFWGFLIYMFQSMKKNTDGSGRSFGFGKSKAKLFTPKQTKITFLDVAGVEEAKEELMEIVEFLKNPKKFQTLGGHIPKGALLMGHPGTGKTLLARAVAGEAGVPFFSISGSDFVEMFVGVGASRVRDLFEQGKKNAPCIIFIDEIDAVGSHRVASLTGGSDERGQTLNQLLVEMDGFDSNAGIILLAATNRPDVLDTALLRSGRFDRQIVVPLPDIKGREAILKVHTKKVPLAEDVNLLIIARGTPGFSGAQLANLANEAAVKAAGLNKKQAAAADFEWAKEKVLMGKERKSLVFSEEEKRITAYHEAGHTLVAHLTPGSDPVHKVTIIPRGMALGLTQMLPYEEKHNHSKDYLEGSLAILLAGRLAEKIFLKTETTGAANDFKVATERARKMVTEWGLSELGYRTFGDEDILGGKTAERINQEVDNIITKARDKAEIILTNNGSALKRLAETLLEKETLDGREVAEIISGNLTNQDSPA